MGRRRPAAVTYTYRSCEISSWAHDEDQCRLPFLRVKRALCQPWKLMEHHRGASRSHHANTPALHQTIKILCNKNLPESYWCYAEKWNKKNFLKKSHELHFKRFGWLLCHYRGPVWPLFLFSWVTQQHCASSDCTIRTNTSPWWGFFLTSAIPATTLLFYASLSAIVGL